MREVASGSPANLEGPVALRHRLAPVLPNGRYMKNISPETAAHGVAARDRLCNDAATVFAMVHGMSPQPAPALTVGFVGLGIMGTPMAANALRAGFEVHVSHRSPERVASLLDRGARWAGTPRALAEASDVLVVMLPDLPDLEPMLTGETGMLAGIRRPTVLVISSTSSAAGVRELDERVGRLTGGLLRVIDSPVSGGEEGALAGTLSLFVGGPADTVEQVRPVLETFGRVHHLGPLGSGEVAKYCNQLIVSATVHALGEAAVLADRSGLDVAALFTALAGGYANSRVLESRGPRIVAEDYRPTGAAKYMVKDLSFALEEAHRTGVDARQLAVLLDAFRDLTERGFGDEDMAVTRAYIESLSREG
jgi:2-hydroxy-3-oxopropionate reductase